MKDAARATHSLGGSVAAAQEFNGHCPRRSSPCAHRRSSVHAVNRFGCRELQGYAGIVKFSPLRSTAQARRAFFDAMATTARQ